jgi:hypothetical protein
MATSLVQKLQLKVDHRLAVVNAPDGYLEQLTPELEGIAVSAKATGKSDAVLLFVNDLAEAERLSPKAIRAVEEDGLLWIAYPKGSSKVKTDVNRDSLRKTVELIGWQSVRQIALDDVWSAMRFRPAEKVGK